MLFVVTLVCTMLFHMVRKCFELTVRLKATVLGVIFAAKSMLFTFDLIVQALLLYSLLVHLGSSIFQGSRDLTLMLMIIVFSPVVTMTTNSLVNLPLHYAFIKLKLDINGESSVGFKRIFRAALDRAFSHWAVIACDLLAIFIFICTFWLLQILHTSNSDLPQTFDQVKSFFGLGSSDTLTKMVQINVMCNYGIGIITGLVFWGLKIPELALQITGLKK
jgi:hypothetical protein